MNQSLAPVDYAIIITYIVFALGVGLYMSKRASKSAESYFLGGRTLPWWMLAISMVATSFASDTPLVVTEFVRGRGIQRIWWVFVGVVPLVVGIFLFSRLWRRAALITDSEFYELRFAGKPAAVLRGFNAFMSGVVINLVVMAWVILGMSSVVTVMTPFNEVWAIVLCVGVALVYATLSGFYGVTMTDFVQFFVALFSMIALAVLAVIKFGGMETVLDAVRNAEGYGERTFSMVPRLDEFSLDLVSLMILIFVMSWHDVGGYTMQRWSACRNERDAMKASIFMAMFQAARPWMWAVVALVSIGLFPVLEESFEDRHAYAMVMNAYLGPGMKGLLVTAFLAAFMSTIDTHLNWGASYLMTDLYTRFINPNPSRRRYMAVTYLCVVLLMLGAGAIVYILPSITRAWEVLAFLGVGGGVIRVARWFWWRINAWTQITALVLGILACITDLLLYAYNPTLPLVNAPWNEDPLRFEIKILAFTVIVLAASLAVTYMTPPTPQAKLDAFYRKVRPGGFWGGVSPEIRALKGTVLNKRTALDIVFGLCLCYGVSLGIGYSILLKWTHAGVCAFLAVVGAVGVYYWYQREIAMMPDDEEAT